MLCDSLTYVMQSHFFPPVLYLRAQLKTLPCALVYVVLLPKFTWVWFQFGSMLR